jgi:hypothetical protein
MLPLLHELERSYLARCNDASRSLSAWRDVALGFPPDAAQYAQSGTLPSRQLSGVSGDLGMAILWIVQATIVRLFIRDIIAAASAYHSRMASISATDIGALAHSEDRDAPVTIEETVNSIILSGTKKYITGGFAADFLLITARRKGDDGITKLVFLPREYLPSGALIDLSLSILRTTPHASLKLNDLELPRDHLVMIEPAPLRRALKVWGIVERGLIADSFVGLCLYCSQKLQGKIPIDVSFVDLFGSLLAQTSAVALAMLRAALIGERVIEHIPLAEIMQTYSLFKNKLSTNSSALSPEISLRLADLTLFETIRF